MNNSTGQAAPTTRQERIQSLDVLRGFALLGILVMNIQTFAMPLAAYMNPTAYGDLTGLNWWIWALSHLTSDQKFMTLFSMLFGAGIVLMSTRLEAKGVRAAAIHYRRTFFLLLFGGAHAYLLWYGDILVWYSLCSLVVFLFRKRSARTLAILGLLAIAVPSAFNIFTGLSMSMIPAEARQEMAADWSPSEEAIEEEIETYRSGWLAQMQHHLPTAALMHTFLFLIFAFWRAGGLMLVGMALYKWGVLSARCSNRCYAGMVVGGLGLGWPLIAYGMTQNAAAGWSMEYSMFLGSQFNYWGSLAVSTGYIGIIMLVCKSAMVQALTSRLAAVGQMALTNYLLHTILCTTIFYGHGLGYFGSVERSGQVLVVMAIWLLQLTVSPIWLRHYFFGPFEWLWRSLTYGAPQPMRR